MGNSANSLPFDIGAQKSYGGNSHWQLNAGTKKEDGTEKTKLEVAIFRFAKAQQDKLPLATKFHQKMRTLKHPYILSYLEGADLGDSMVVVAEACQPLEEWLKSRQSRDQTEEEKSILIQEVMWGFKCVLNGLSFLHSTCNSSHNYLGLHSIFVCKNGDWKLGALDLSCNLSVAEDVEYLRKYANLLSAPYISPERLQFIRDGTVDVKLQGSADIFSLAAVMTTSFDALDCTLPGSVKKVVSAMNSTDVRKRPTSSQLLKHPIFNTDHILLLDNLGELSIKPPSESLEVLNAIMSKVSSIPKSVCEHQLLPSITRLLQIAVNDFTNRDSRESSRQSIQLCITLLSKMATEKKIDASTFHVEGVPIMVTLWGMSDRTVRTALLTSLSSLLPLFPDTVVNKSIFDPMLAGFADSNAKMREETLKNLVHVISKLDERNRQEKLVRCIVSLQTDAEASIRTNATIFLGRIAASLSEAVRAKVLCNCYCKAMKDNFLHCRVAGLKAASASLALIDNTQTATKLLPQVCIMVLDKSKEVRELALKLLESGTAKLQQFHVQMTQQEAAQAKRPNSENGLKNSSFGDGGSNSNADTNNSNSWTSWAVEGLTKSLDIAATTAGASHSSSANAASNNPTKKYSLSNNNSSIPEASSAPSTPVAVTEKFSSDTKITPANYSKYSNTKQTAAEDSWGDELDIDDIDAVDGKGSMDMMDSSTKYGLQQSSKNDTNWEIDVDFEDLDEDNVVSPNSSYNNNNSVNMTSSTPPRHPSSKASNSNSSRPPVSAVSPAVMSISGAKPKTPSNTIKPSTSNNSMNSMNSASASANNAAAKKPAVTKLAVDDGENWDDF